MRYKNQIVVGYVVASDTKNENRNRKVVSSRMLQAETP